MCQNLDHFITESVLTGFFGGALNLSGRQLLVQCELVTPDPTRTPRRLALFVATSLTSACLATARRRIAHGRTRFERRRRLRQIVVVGLRGASHGPKRQGNALIAGGRVRAIGVSDCYLLKLGLLANPASN